MSRTDMDAATLARSLRRMAGDGGMEWCCEPIRASVLLDVADLLDENAKLRELVRGLWYCAHEAYGMCARVLVGGERPFTCCPLYDYDSKVYRCEKLILELGVEVDG